MSTTERKSVSADVLKGLNNSIKDVKEMPILTKGVYKMTIHSVEIIESKPDKHGVVSPMLKVLFDTGYQKMESTEPRLMSTVFWLDGTTAKGEDRNKDLAAFLKNCFKITNIQSVDTLYSIKSRNLSVATKKDENGFIAYWYAGHIDNLEHMKSSYKTKDDSGNAPVRQNNPVNENYTPDHSTMPDTPPTLDPETGQPI